MYSVVAIGVSAGGLKALSAIIPKLNKGFPLPVIVVQHRAAGSDDYLITHLNSMSAINVKEAAPGELIVGGTVYIAPAGYHLQVEENETFSLSVDVPVKYSIPSIDVLFETASDVYGEKLIGIVLTGANDDGSDGLKVIKSNGGLAIVEDPKTAEVSTMPLAAISAVSVDHVLGLDGIVDFLNSLVKEEC